MLSQTLVSWSVDNLKIDSTKPNLSARASLIYSSSRQDSRSRCFDLKQRVKSVSTFFRLVKSRRYNRLCSDQSKAKD